jgi:hypothetical protein
MSRFANRDEQQAFIADSDRIFTMLINKLSPEKQLEAKNLVDQHYVTWKKILQLPVEKNVSELVDKDVCRLEKLYDELKNSVQFEVCASDQLTFPQESSTIDECISNIQDIRKLEKHTQHRERMVQYQLGCEIYRLKRLCKTKKHFEIVVKESLKYSCSYAYFLMKLYEACNKFVNLRFTTISVNKLMRDFSNLVELMEQDLAFWSPPSNISTPTGSCIN